MDLALIKKLETTAKEIRKDVVEMIYHAGSGHPGGSLSAADLITALYFNELNIDPKNPRWEDRDRFILSKGHCCPVLYAALARVGFFPLEELKTLRKFRSRLQGHPSMNKTPGVDMNSGSLGNGISIGIGRALGARLDGKSYRVFVMVGDGELQEGMNWEALMAAAHFKLKNLIVIIDYNNLQVDGSVDEIMDIAPLKQKITAFGWQVYEVDGHNMREILDTFARIRHSSWKGPSAIIAYTVKGKGVSFMENRVEWHGRALSQRELEVALKELDGRETGKAI